VTAGAPSLFALASVASTLAGAYFLTRNPRWTERYLWRLLAFGSGTLLGITFVHLLPEAWTLNARWAGGAALLAFVLFFVVEQFTVVHACSELMEDCHVHTLGYGALAALSVHSFSDGLAMGFSFMSSESLGFFVSAGVLLHKFSDGLTLTSLLLAAGYPAKKAWGLILALALATPLGMAASLGSARFVTPQILAALLGLAAGGFFYVSTADILPRIHKRRDPLCWIFLLAGALMSLALGHY
jgi:zinc and cadmium transporter